VPGSLVSSAGAEATEPAFTIKNLESDFDQEVLYVEGRGDIVQDKGVVHFKYVGTNPEDAGLLRLDVESTGFTQAIWIRTSAEATNTSSAIFMDTNHGGQGIYIQHSGGLTALRSKHFKTNEDTSGAIISNAFGRSFTVDDGGTYTNAGTIVEINNEVTETLGTITDTVVLVDINQTHSTHTGTVVRIDNNGVGRSLAIGYTGNLAANSSIMEISTTTDLVSTTRTMFRVYTNTVHASGRMVSVINDNTASVVDSLIFLQDDGVNLNGMIRMDNNNNGKAIYVDHDDTGTNPSIDVDRDGNNASPVTALDIQVDNAGAGGVIGIDFSTMSTNEWAMKFVADANDPTAGGGAAIGRIAINIGGVTRYLAYY
jgi:nitrogen regulatory protein PII-like uncharacterized protein